MRYLILAILVIMHFMSYPLAYFIHTGWKIPKGTSQRKILEGVCFYLFFGGFVGSVVWFLMFRDN